jgi:hypothetical protein
MNETRIICPLGSRCEEIKDGVIVRCAWYTRLIGKDPQSEREYDEWRCAIAWLPIMQVEVAQTNRGQTEAICSLRDETIRRQEVFNVLAAESIRRKELTNNG